MTLASYRVLVAVGAVFIFFTHFANYSLTFGIEPLYWIMGFLALAAPVLGGTWQTVRLRLEPILVWSLAFVLLSIIWFFVSSQSALAWQQVQTRVLSVTFLFLMLFLFADCRARRAARRAIVAATALIAGFNLYELFHPMTFSDIPGRSTGLFDNVNQSGAALVLGLILGQGVVSPRYRPGFVLMTGIGLLPTFSRAAILGWLMVVAVSWAISGIRGRGLVTLGLLGLASSMFLLTPWWGDLQQSLAARGVLTTNVRDRLAFFERGTTADASTTERLGVARLAWETFADHPIIGMGTGAATETIFTLGPHNMYLTLMVDHGIIGLFVFPTLLLAACWRASDTTAPVVVPLTLFLLFWGLFSHNVLEERYLLLTVALVAAMVAADRQEQDMGQKVWA